MITIAVLISTGSLNDAPYSVAYAVLLTLCTSTCLPCVSACVQIAQTAGSCGPVSVVVSPLVSLVHDQVTALQNNGVAACALKVRMCLFTVTIEYDFMTLITASNIVSSTLQISSRDRSNICATHKPNYLACIVYFQNYCYVGWL
jgi:hypothetical protein